MITDATDVRVALLCEYFARLLNPVVVLSVCQEQHDDGKACRDSRIIVYTNDAFPASETQHALRHAEPWSCSRRPDDSSRVDASFTRGEGEYLSGLNGWASDWTWTTRTLMGGTVLVIEGTAVPTRHRSSAREADPSVPRQIAAKPSPSLSLPTPTHPKPFPSRSGSDLTACPAAALEHNALFLSLPWSTSALGHIDTWDTQLRGIVQIMMASPFPVLISYGPEYVLLYNEPYSKVIGAKHPSILGMKYGEAWPEIWSALEPVIRAGYQGSVLNVDCQEMFLMRGARLEGTFPRRIYLAYLIETYFSYSLIPIRDHDDMVCGLYIPNFDNTVRIITERRIRSLHEISRCMNRSLTQEGVIQDALTGMQHSNARDMHFALFYIAENADRETWPGGRDVTGNDSVRGSDRKRIRGSHGSFADNRPQKSLPSLRSESIASSGNQDAGVSFRLVGSYGIDIRPDGDDIPRDFLSIPEDVDHEASSAELINPIIRLVRQVRSQDSALFIPDLTEIPSLSALPNGNPFDDAPRAAIVLPIRSSVEDRLHGVMLLGLNTRAPWDEDYSNYVQLVKGLLATGLATIKLHEEDLARARYMAALNRQKNEELQSLLTHRTEELKTSELKFRSAFASCPAAIWIGAPDGRLWDVNLAYKKMSGLQMDACLDDWIHR